ncbi:hypothetical protein BJ912DRAFT_1148121 [Pholiota molesta]|nr:hypothetical protein BJ912DRAFT_1148121 [Pholiota molesta]
MVDLQNRRSKLGNKENSEAVTGTSRERIALATYLLPGRPFICKHSLPLGNDGFFSTASSGHAVQNPLALYELMEFSRQLLNIAFTLYVHDEGSVMQEVYIAPLVPCSWEAVRDAVLAWDPCKRFAEAVRPCGLRPHWLVTSQLDMNSFVKAAVLEEQQLSKADNPLQGPHHLFAQQLAAMLPCLSILNNIPFASPFEVRVSIFRHFMLNDIGGRGNKKNDLYPNPHAYATDVHKS